MLPKSLILLAFCYNNNKPFEAHAKNLQPIYSNTGETYIFKAQQMEKVCAPMRDTVLNIDMSYSLNRNLIKFLNS